MATFKIINPNTLAIEHSYEADEVVTYGGPWNSYLHIVVPEGLDVDCVKAELVDDVVTLVADTDAVAAKVLAAKVRQCENLEATLWSEILAEMNVVFSTTDMNSATAYYLTWQEMLAHPADYVGSLFADEAAVTAYATPKLAAAKAFSVWRLGKIATCNAAKQLIMA